MKRIVLLFILFELCVSVYAQNSQSPEWQTYLQEYTIQDIADAGDYLWLVASENTELIKFEKSSGIATKFSFNDFNIQYNDWITNVECDQYGTPYVGTYAGSFKRNDNKQWVLLHHGGTADILVSKSGAIWLANQYELIKYQGDSIGKTFNLSSDFEFYLFLTSLTEDNERNLWAINYNTLIFYGDLVKFDGKNWTTYHMPEYYNDDFFLSEDGFPKINLEYTFFINDIKIDRHNKIWMSKTKSNYNGELETLSNGSNVYPSRSELVSFKDSSWATFNPPVQARINSIAPDDESIWCATDHGLMQFNNSNWTVFDFNNSEIPTNQVNSVLVDREGTKWLGTEKGLVSFHESELKTPVETEPKMFSGFEVFPNPAKDYIILKMPAEFQNSTVDILDLQGKTLKTFNINYNENRFNISALPRGIYLTRICTDKSYALKKFVKE